MEIEKSKDETKKKETSSVDAFARLRSQLKSMGANGLQRKTVYLLLDASGSMHSYCTTKDGGSKTKSQAVEAVVGDVLSTYNHKVNISMAKFSYGAEFMFTLKDYRVSGETNIQEALRLLSVGGSQAILLSDGGETVGDARAEIPRLVESQIVVNTIGVGDDSGEALLREIAEKTGGEYAKINADFSAIFETFKRLASKAVAALTEGGKS